MSKLILTAGLCLIISSLASSSTLMCYFTRWSKYREGNGRHTVSDVDPNLCTHLIFAFANINFNSELVPFENDADYYEAFNGLKAKNSGLKTLLSVGGWNFGPSFGTMVSTQENRQKFIDSSITLLETYGFDGINLDWEFPETHGRHGFTLLCQELHDRYTEKGLLVTAAVAANRITIDASYEVAEIAKYLHFMNVMTYDLRGTWDRATGHHSPLFAGPQDYGNHAYLTTDYAMRYWRDQGVPSEKLLLGIGTYGRTFTLSSETSGFKAPISGAGTAGKYTREAGILSYYEVCDYFKGATFQPIEGQMVSYKTKERQWVGIDNINSINAKVNYLKENNFGGAFVWSLDLDDFSGLFCNQGKYPLIGELHNLLISGAPVRQTAEEPGENTDETAPDPEITTADSTGQLAAMTTTTTTSAESSEGFDPNFCEGKPTGLYPIPNDPSRYYSCGNGVTYVQNCPPGLVYQDSCKCCNWP